MFDDRSRKYGNQYVPLKPVNVDLYEPYIGKEALDWIKFLARPLEKKVWAIRGGGVSCCAPAGGKGSGPIIRRDMGLVSNSEHPGACSHDTASAAGITIRKQLL